MPHLYPHPLPDAIRRDLIRRAEVRVYDALAEQLGPTWHVFHSVAWLSKAERGAFDGEADFVIAHPEHGVLVLEVKGGEIRFDAARGQWYSKDARGAEHEIQDPFAQAVRSKKALLGKLKELPATASRFLAMAHAVCFPGIAKGRLALRPDAPLAIVLDADDLTHLTYSLPAILAYSGRDTKPPPLGPDGISALRQVLARSFALRMPLGVVAQNDERAMLELTEQQFGLLDFLARQRRAAIQGGAGTGKTLLALEKARRLAAEGFRTLLTCFNVPLAAYLQASAGDVPGLIIQRFHALCQDAAQAAKLPVPIHPPTHPVDTYWNEQLPEALQEAVARGFPRFDAIVVDEAQDFQSHWWIPLRECLTDPDHGIFYVFHDDQQRVFNPGATFLEDLPSFPLTRNVRNTQAIATLAAAFAASKTVDCAGPPGRTVEIVSPEDGHSLAETLLPVLQRLMRQEQVSAGEIAVLSGRKPESIGLTGDAGLGKLATADSLHRQPACVTLDTIHRFKGLEAAVVILTGLSGLHPANEQALLYVGMTRARSHLVIVEREEVLRKYGLQGTGKA